MSEKKFYEIWDTQIPIGDFPCWTFDPRNLQEFLKNKDYLAATRPTCYFKLTQRIDENFIAGYLGHTTYKGRYHDAITDSYSYFVDFKARRPVYFTFDKVTLYRLTEIHPSDPLTFIFKRIDSPQTIKTNQAFMIMPFKDKSLNTLYTKHIRDYLLKEMSIKIFRSDDFNGNDIIVETIYKQIDESEFIIADTSHPNKNVFYEFGYAAAKEKEIITIQNTAIDKSLFFDRGHIRAVLYSPKNIPDLQRQLKNTIIAIRDKVSAKN